MATRRPSNRKEQIRTAADELFLERGFRNVSVSDVADAVDITPAALYHHYRNKRELLFAVVIERMHTLDTLLDSVDHLDDALSALVTHVAGRDGIRTVSQREIQSLDPQQQAEFRAGRTDVAAKLVPMIKVQRPDLDQSGCELIAQAILGVFASFGRHRIRLSLRKDAQFLLDLARVVSRAALPAVDMADQNLAESVAADSIDFGLRASRRDLLVAEAIRLFDSHGYQSVTMRDIGEAAGIVASGVYRHFSSKTELLVTAMGRGGDLMSSATDRALAEARSPSEAVELLLRAHIDVAVEHDKLVRILTTERDELPLKERTALRRLQADYQHIWIQALSTARPDRDVTELKMTIHATHSMIQMCARSDFDAALPVLEERLTRLGMALLLDS